MNKRQRKKRDKGRWQQLKMAFDRLLGPLDVGSWRLTRPEPAKEYSRDDFVKSLDAWQEEWDIRITKDNNGPV